MPEEKKEEYEVEILSEDVIITYPKLGQPVETVAVTYVAAGLPPATIFIPKEEYSEEELKKRIREDIERRLKRRARTLKV